MEKVKSIFDKLKATPGKLDKELILKSNADNTLFKDILHYILNPFITTGLSTKKIKKHVNTSHTQNFSNVLEVMEYLKHSNTGTDEVIVNVQRFVEQQPADMQEFYEGIFTKSLKFGCGDTTVNKVYGANFVPKFDCMLADKYFEHPDRVEGKDFTLTLKLDGIRCIAIKQGGKVSLFSRQGQPITGLVDIETELMKHRNDFVLDGELLISDTSGIASKDQYKATTKIVRKDGKKIGITFRVFDYLTTTDFYNQKGSTPYYQRRAILENSFVGMQYTEVLSSLYSGNDTSQIYKLLDKVRAEEQEGLILNLNDAPYEFKRTKNLLKVKVMQDCDLRIVGFEEGQGRLAGTLGRLNVEYKGNIVGVGSGFSDQQRDYFWNNRDSLIGRIACVQYFEETKNQDGGISLRFPVFKELREQGKQINY